MSELLAFDIDSSCKLGQELKEIFDSHAHFHLDLYKDWKGKDKAFKTKEILNVISKQDPLLIFLLFSSNSLGKIKALIKVIKNRHPDPNILVIFENGNTDEIVSLLESGVVDFITPPFKAIDIIPRISRLIRQIHKSRQLTISLKEKLGLNQLVGENPSFVEEVKKIPIIARCNSTVLISGETGTGKGMFANSIHNLSPRANYPFIPVNCGAIPSELIENELFGHVQGAYTGATTLQEGLIHEANKGTLFLDEIDCLPLSAQAKLLRFLQDRVYRRLGSSRMIHADIRLIAATNNNLKDAVKEGNFRQDLFYRVNIIPLTLPPLRERKDDIPVLAKHFLFQYSSELNQRVSGFTTQALQKLVFYEWPGNVRELENIIQRALVFAQEEEIREGDIHLSLKEPSYYNEPFQAAKAKVIEEFEKSYIMEILMANRGNITKSAKKAGKNRRAFWELIRKNKIDVEYYKKKHHKS